MNADDRAKRLAELLAQQAAVNAQIAALTGDAGAMSEGQMPDPEKVVSVAAVVQGNVTADVFVGRDWNQVLVSHYGPTHQTQAQLVKRYLSKMVELLNVVDLARLHDGFDGRDREPPKLGDLYVPLSTTFAIEDGSTLDMALRAPLLHERSAKQADKLRPAPVMAALQHHADMMLIGEAGSGKSTVGACVFMALANAGLGDDAALASLADGPRPWPHARLVPWILVLRRFAAWLGSQEPTEASVWNYWESELNGIEAGQKAALLASLKALSDRQGAWVFMDGLDECGDAQARERVLRALHLFKQGVNRQTWRFLTTARPNARPRDAQAQHGVYTLAPLSSEQRQAFIEGWYRVQVRRGWAQESEVQALAQDLIHACQRPDILPLAQRPLLLTLMALIHGNDGGHLPDGRVELFESAVRLLLLRWNVRDKQNQTLQDLLKRASGGGADDLKMRDLERKLCELAFVLHKGQQGQGKPGELQAADIGEAQLCRHLQSLLGPDETLVRQVVQHIEEGSGLLVGKGAQMGTHALEERRFAFPHRLFQEYLAAKWLATSGEFPKLCLELADADRDATDGAGYWHEALAMAGRIAEPRSALDAANALVCCTGPDKDVAVSPQQLKHALVAAALLTERGVQSSEAEYSGKAVVGHVRQWLQAAARPLHPQAGGMHAPDRVRAANALGQLGDPRFDPQRFFLPADPTLGFVHVPANPHFVIGTHPGDAAMVKRATGYAPPSDELNDQPSPHGEFWMAKYPVTVAQFRAYCAADGVQPGDPDALRGAAHHPVEWVNWAEAQAYARWLTQQMQTGALKSHPVVRDWPKGFRICLPSELEWEAAARAGQARAVFPWGEGHEADQWDEELANAVMKIGSTSPVGSYPPNRLGLHDMAGNVCEWTRSRWAKDGQEKEAWPYPYRADESGREVMGDEASEPMVVRGGSFDNDRRRARCGYRGYDLPDVRFFSLGFRLVVVFSPV